MDSDLEIDSAPMDVRPAGKFVQMHHASHLETKGANHGRLGQDERFDSAYESGNLPSEGCETRTYGAEDELLPVSRQIQHLSLRVNSGANCKESADPRLPSVDEGFCSEDVPLDLSNKSSRNNTDSEKKPELNVNAYSNEQVEAFVQHVEEMYTQDEDGDTRLHTAIIQLLLDYCLYIISLAPCAKYLNLKNSYQQTSLHLAAITRQAQLTRKLMTSGAQVDARDHKGNTPLHIAAKEGYADITAVLVEPVFFEETSGNTYDIPYQAIPQDLEARNYDGQVCIHLAAEGCHIDTLNILLNIGANVNCRDGKSGRSVLHYAAESGNIVLLEFLLQRPDIDVNAMTYSRLTPIMLAKGRGHTEAARMLKERGAIYYADNSDDEEMRDDSVDEFEDARIGGVPIK